MIVLGFAVLLYVLAAYLMVIAHRRDRRQGTTGLVKTGIGDAWTQFTFVLPRLVVGLMGAGFLAALVPTDLVESYLSEEAGWTAFALAYGLGAITPGGVVVGLALGVAALKAGASVPVVVIYVTAWALMNVPRVFIWEMALVPRVIIVQRLLVSAPLPLLAGFLTWLVIGVAG